MLTMPTFAVGEGLVTCGRGADVASGRPADSKYGCTFQDALTLINKVINFILVYMVVPIAAIMFAYAGFLLVTAGGEVASARTKAKEIFLNALIGLAISVACWLIIKTLLSILRYNATWIGF